MRSSMATSGAATPESSATMCKPQSIPRTISLSGPRGDKHCAPTAINCRIWRSRREPEMGVMRSSMPWLIAATTRARRSSSRLRGRQCITVTLPKPAHLERKRRQVVSASKILSISQGARRCSIFALARERLTYRATTNDAGKINPTLLDECVQSVCAGNQSAHPTPRVASQRWGASRPCSRLCRRCRLDHHPEKMTIRRQTSGASVRHDQVLDGSNALSSRNGCQRWATEMSSAQSCSCLQHQVKRDGDHRRGRAAGGPGMTLEPRDVGVSKSMPADAL